MPTLFSIFDDLTESCMADIENQIAQLENLMEEMFKKW